MDCRRSPPKTDTETRRRVRSCTGSRSRSLRGKLETFPWAQGGPCDHAEVAGKPRLWPGGKERCESGVSRARPQSALSEETRDGGSVPLPTMAKFLCNSSAVPRPPQDAAVPPESPGSVGPRGVGGDRSPRGGKRCLAVQNRLRVRSPPRVQRVPQGEGSNKEDKKSKSLLQKKM